MIVNSLPACINGNGIDLDLSCAVHTIMLPIGQLPDFQKLMSTADVLLDVISPDDEMRRGEARGRGQRGHQRHSGARGAHNFLNRTIFFGFFHIYLL